MSPSLRVFQILQLRPLSFHTLSAHNTCTNKPPPPPLHQGRHPGIRPLYLIPLHLTVPSSQQALNPCCYTERQQKTAKPMNYRNHNLLLANVSNVNTFSEFLGSSGWLQPGRIHLLYTPINLIILCYPGLYSIRGWAKGGLPLWAHETEFILILSFINYCIIYTTVNPLLPTLYIA